MRLNYLNLFTNTAWFGVNESTEILVIRQRADCCKDDIWWPHPNPLPKRGEGTCPNGCFPITLARPVPLPMRMERGTRALATPHSERSGRAAGSRTATSVLPGSCGRQNWDCITTWRDGTTLRQHILPRQIR